MPCKQILLVEDDPAIAEPLIYALEREGWAVHWVTLAAQALERLTAAPHDFIILDVGLPDMDGFDLCRAIRKQWTTPLLFLTARSEEIERIIGLEIGADDYCAKPFSPREIISRIKVIWRRMNAPDVQQHSVKNRLETPETIEKSNETEHVIAWGEWELNLLTFHVTYHGVALNLTRYELRLLEVLLKQPERVWSRGQLMQAAWEHPDHSLERTIDSHIKTLRQKLRMVHPIDPIQTHRGLGYSLSR
ncbi:MAG: two-component system response regulator CreB [Gammaproteobacteria bacterium]|nr:two-component system response regulator CreB [Gammaproteobacteria bacterium]